MFKFNEQNAHSADRRFRAELPEALRSHLQKAERIVFVMESDVRADGDHGSAWLVLTENRILSLDEESGIRVSIPLDSIENVYNDELFGSGRVIVETGDGLKTALIDYSRKLVPEFAAAALLIKDAAADQEIVFPELEGSRSTDSEKGGNPQHASRWKILSRIAAFMLPYRTRIVALTLLITAATVAQMAVPLFTKYIVDNILGQGAYANHPEAGGLLDKYVGFIAICFAIMLITRLIGNTMKVWISARLTADMRNALHKQMQRLTMTYHNRKESGQLIARVMNDTGELQHFLVDGLPFIFINLLSFVGIGAILFWLHPVLAILVFLPVPLLLGGGAWFWKRLIPLFHKRGNRTSVLHGALGESIHGVKSVKSLSQESRRQDTFVNSNDELFRVTYGVDKTFVKFFEILAMFMGLCTVAVWYFGGHSILDPNSTFTVGDLIAFIGYMAMFYGPLQWFTGVINWMSHAFASSERILQVLDEEPENYHDPEALAMPRSKGHITFDDVRFSYTRGKEIIKGISFDIQPGEMIGIVGKSGGGKSTLIDLLCRFYDVDSGAIRIDGHDLRDIRLADWRNNIGIVLQNPFVFSGTIKENIAYGNPDASFTDILRAARAAKAHEFILDKEEGYDTVVGDGGINLSGGEKQRIAIARAILSDPPVLILDEATSAVDAETEKAIQEAIANLVKGRTTIAIAHRLATLRDADKIIVIRNGSVIEQGDREELLRREDGHFASLVKHQTDNNRMREAEFAEIPALA